MLLVLRMPHTSDQAASTSNATAAAAEATSERCVKAAQEDRPISAGAAEPSRNAPRKMARISPSIAVVSRARAKTDRIDRLPVSLLFPVARDAWRSMAPYGPHIQQPPPPRKRGSSRPSLSSLVTRMRGDDVPLLRSLRPFRPLALTMLFGSIACPRRFCHSNFASCLISSSSKVNFVGLPCT